MEHGHILNKVGISLTEGYKAQVIDKYSKSLNVNLPISIKDFYRKYANTFECTESFNKILSPEEWYIENDRLVFAEENQGVVLWGVEIARLKEDDPIVQIATSSEPIEWHNEDLVFSTFSLFMMLYNLAMGTFNNLQELDIDNNRLNTIRERAILDIYDNQMRIILIDDIIIAVMLGNDNHHLIANSKDSFDISEYL